MKANRAAASSRSKSTASWRRAAKIDPSLIKPEEAEILEDLIVAAFQDAKRKAEAAAQAKMQEITGGLALPPGLKLF